MSKEIMESVYEEIKSGGGDNPSIDWEVIKKKLRRMDDEPLIYLYYQLQEVFITPDIRLLALYTAGELMTRKFSLRAQEVYKKDMKIEKPKI